ncbi:MAG: hypothetical protein AMXMBFR84_34290 [Candidatus Hydrogenedentota bacterium]
MRSALNWGFPLAWEELAEVIVGFGGEAEKDVAYIRVGVDAVSFGGLDEG